jgi:D-alanyl-D-alanine carboxypeptidase
MSYFCKKTETMNAKDTQTKIEKLFRNQVQNDKKVKNAYLLVHSSKLGIDLNIAEGETGNNPANPAQASHMASVGKLFTATLIGILYERGIVDYNEKIINYLDKEIMDGLHVYKGVDYSGEITVKHLLTQTSGLNDVFYKLFKKMMDKPNLKITTREAIAWGKKNLKPVAKPGKKHYYTDTNYYLLGFIIESVCKKPFHQLMHELILQPLGMENTYLFGFTNAETKPQYPTAGIYLYGRNFINDKRFAQLDYAGGSITAPMEDLLKFMEALVNHQLVKKSTLDKMIYDDIKMGFPAIGFDYGYSVWKPKAIPVLMPKKFFCWGCVGVTGAFMFYHPQTESYVIGTFNDKSYTSKALRFMLTKVIRELIKFNN